MQPIHVALGLTATVLALIALVGGEQVAYLLPHSRVLAALYWPQLAAYGGLAVAGFVFLLYAAARAMGLADLGRKVDLVERSIRRGAGGDPELAQQMRQQERGDFQE